MEEPLEEGLDQVWTRMEELQEEGLEEGEVEGETGSGSGSGSGLSVVFFQDGGAAGGGSRGGSGMEEPQEEGLEEGEVEGETLLMVESDSVDLSQDQSGDSVVSDVDPDHGPDQDQDLDQEMGFCCERCHKWITTGGDVGHVYLSLEGSGRQGYFRWKEDICAFIGRHWTFLLGTRKRTSTWWSTVAGCLSVGSPAFFRSGAQEFGEPGWWKLVQNRPPTLRPEAEKSAPRSKPCLDPTITVEGLRKRGGKNPVEKAMQLKEKRCRTQEAKDIRRAQRDQRDRSNPKTSKTPKTPKPGAKPELMDLSSMSSSDRTPLTSPSPSPSLLSEADLIPDAMPPQALFHDDEELEAESVIDPGMEYVPPTSALIGRKKARPPASAPIKREAESEDEEADKPNDANEAKQSVQSEPASAAAGGGASQGARCVPIGPYEERLLLRRLEACPLALAVTPSAKRLRRKLLVRQEKRSRGLPLLDVDRAVSLNPGSSLRRQTLSSVSFFHRVMGSESEPNQTIRSPYTARILKPYIRSEPGLKQDSNSPDPQALYQVVKTGIFKPGLTVYRALNQDHTRGKRHYQDLKPAGPRSKPGTNQKLSLNRTLVFKNPTIKPGVPAASVTGDATSSFLPQAIGVNALLCPTSHLPSPRNNISRTPPGRYTPTVTLRMSQDAFWLHKTTPTLCASTYLVQPESESCLDGRAELCLCRLPILDAVPDCVVAVLVFRVRAERVPAVPDFTVVALFFVFQGLELSECLQYPDFTVVALFLFQAWAEPAVPRLDGGGAVLVFQVPDYSGGAVLVFQAGVSECLRTNFTVVALYKKVVVDRDHGSDVKYNQAYISFLLVHPDWRRAGIGKFMIYHLIQTCMGKDVTLHVSASNPAMLLYQKFGFRAEEYILDFYDKYYPLESSECRHAFLLRLRR
ncbi:hypothetical protein WMY93_006715 [Mugilogobius chulae]|uniref:N-acetyltransferase domain-containing protein n=1 Tax=Mugilogobius chulae TaxID=88201 RepID=A0AAW0PKY3_9GOBI